MRTAQAIIFIAADVNELPEPLPVKQTVKQKTRQE